VEIYCDYIDTSADVMEMFNHTALEALLRAIEDDISFAGNRCIDLIDLRAKDAIESVSIMRDLIRRPEFILDLHLVEPDLENPTRNYVTPYGREVKRAWSTNHRMVETSKGWAVFDSMVNVCAAC
jgi:hypothetical protein